MNWVFWMDYQNSPMFHQYHAFLIYNAHPSTIVKAKYNTLNNNKKVFIYYHNDYLCTWLFIIIFSLMKRI